MPFPRLKLRNIAIRLSILASALLVSTLVLDGCRRGHKNRRREQVSWGSIDNSWNPQAVASAHGIAAQTLRDGLERRLAGERPKPLPASAWRRTALLYKQYGHAPLWLDEKGLRRERTAAVLSALASADSDALELSHYPLSALGQALAAVRAEQPTADQLIEVDVLLTSAYAALGQDLVAGQIDPKSMSQDWHISSKADDVDSALVGVLRSEPLDKAIARTRPPEPDYEALRRELQRYRELVARGGWLGVPKGASRKPGEKDARARVEALRNRLRVEGFLADAVRPTSGIEISSDTAIYDQALAGAVAEFQSRHGIVVDSILGAETIESLNLSAEYRLGQIAANLERYRWLARNLGSDYVLVNVPAFRLTAFDSSGPALEMKVIVGAEYEDRNTPVFSDSMQYVVFRPYWNVPEKIAENEIYPKIETDAGYMERNNYEFFRDGGTQRIRQKPGPKNSLGLVKFLFPNDFNIYLHDTPEDLLFDKDVRAFSHGCIRLEKPAELAQWVLGWSADDVRQAMESGPDNKTITLKEKIPVYILYFTTYFRDGRLFFGNDLYKRDEKLVAAVHGGAMPSAEALRASQALRQLAAR